MTYIGRFAPTPTGPLHQGSLLAAVASYCDARAAGGQWLLRIEDLDPPREMAGASDVILRQLTAYGFEWDGPVLYQHQRTDFYLAALEKLAAQGDIFWCVCSRTDLLKHGTIYSGTCHHCLSPRENAAIRLRVPTENIYFHDGIFGAQHEHTASTVGDFVLRRRDGLFAYQLAVTVDDAAQHISHVVRGADLLDNTARQIILQKKLALPPVHYAHIPLVRDAHGHKLSKQTFAAALPLPAQPPLLWQALTQLGQMTASAPADLHTAPCKEQLAWAVAHWQLARVPQALPAGAAPATADIQRR